MQKGNMMQEMQQMQQLPPDPNGDNLRTLPTNKTQPSYNELAMINTLFSDESTNTIQNLFKEFKTDFYIGIFFFVLSLEQVDNLLLKYIPVTQKNKYLLLLVKTVIFVFCVWFLKNFWLAKTGN